MQLIRKMTYARNENEMKYACTPGFNIIFYCKQKSYFLGQELFQMFEIVSAISRII